MDAVCPFCAPPAARIVDRHETALALRDAYPLAPGHTLIVPARHAGSFFALVEAEEAAMLVLPRRAQERLMAERTPDGFTVGLNDGAAAGQTVPQSTCT